MARKKKIPQVQPKRETVPEALGITKDRYEEVKDIVEGISNKTKTHSDLIKGIADNEKLTVIEKVFSGWVMGRMTDPMASLLGMLG